jgi:hypothetical protein
MPLAGTTISGISTDQVLAASDVQDPRGGAGDPAPASKRSFFDWKFNGGRFEVDALIAGA